LPTRNARLTRPVFSRFDILKTPFSQALRHRVSLIKTVLKQQPPTALEAFWAVLNNVLD
jgi:hypothetical protein